MHGEVGIIGGPEVRGSIDYNEGREGDVSYQGVQVCRDGIAAAHDETALAQLMLAKEIAIDCDLHAGTGEATVTFTDLTHAYVDEKLRGAYGHGATPLKRFRSKLKYQSIRLVDNPLVSSNGFT